MKPPEDEWESLASLQGDAPYGLPEPRGEFPKGWRKAAEDPLGCAKLIREFSSWQPRVQPPGSPWENADGTIAPSREPEPSAMEVVATEVFKGLGGRTFPPPGGVPRFGVWDPESSCPWCYNRYLAHTMHNCTHAELRAQVAVESPSPEAIIAAYEHARDRYGALDNLFCPECGADVFKGFTQDCENCDKMIALLRDTPSPAKTTKVFFRHAPWCNGDHPRVDDTECCEKWCQENPLECK
jgi:hypothetical protein